MENPKIYYDDDASLDIIKAKTVLIIGYGNQGRAQALNLFDSGVNVIVGLREKSPSFSIVKSDGLIAQELNLAVEKADIISLLIPDQSMYNSYFNYIHSNLKIGQTLLFSHGYNIFYKKIIPPEYVNVIMVAQSGAGVVVRNAYKKGSGVPNLIAIHQDYSKTSIDIALSYSKAIGGTKAGAFLSTFKEETESDLFGEQAVLCGGIPALIQSAFEILVEEGFQPIVAWYVCFYEVKLIVDVFHEKGFQHMYSAISETAEFGGLKQGSRIINSSVKSELRSILNDIQDKSFYEEFEEDANNSFEILTKMRNKQRNSIFEQISRLINND